MRNHNAVFTEAAAQYDEQQAYIENLEEEKSQLTTNLAEVKKELANAKKTVVDKQKQLEALQASLTATQREREDATQALSICQKKVSDLTKEKQALEKAHKETEKQLKEEFKSQLAEARNDACKAKAELARYALSRDKVEEIKTRFTSFVAETMEAIKTKGELAIEMVDDALDEWQNMEQDATGNYQNEDRSVYSAEVMSFKSHEIGSDPDKQGYLNWLQLQNNIKGNQVLTYLSEQKQMGFTSDEYASRFLNDERYFSLAGSDGKKRLGFHCATMVSDFVSHKFHIKVTRGEPNCEGEAHASDNKFVEVHTYLSNKLRKISKKGGPMTKIRNEMTGETIPLK